MAPAIEVRGLTHRFGELIALDHVEFRVEEGEIFGYLGPNGAGKTTTVSILTSLLEPDAGEVTIAGLDLQRESVGIRQRIGLVPENSNLYPELSCRRNLEYLGELYGLARRRRRERCGELLAEVGLAARSETPFRALSRGMKRRLTVAAALVHSPEVLFLDEPTAGLDVPSARALRSLLRRTNHAGTTVFLTTHNLAEAEQLCSRIVILVKGRVLASGTAREIRERVEQVETLSVAFSGEIDQDALREACPAVTSALSAGDSWRLEIVDVHSAIVQVSSFADRQGLRVTEVSSNAGSLEDAFMTILRDGDEGGGQP